MTRAEIEAWVHLLQPGDEVAVGGYGRDRTMIGIVTKVTPSGIVRTKDHGSFKTKNHYSDNYEYVDGFGSYKTIEPFTPELYAIAKSNMEKIRREAMEQRAISKAQDLALRIGWNKIRITYDQAVKLIAIFESGESDA